MMQATQHTPALALVFSIAAGALFLPSSTLARSPSPFKATLSINEMVQADPTGTCGLIGSIVASGEATHLGRVTATSTDCISPMVPSWYSFGSNQLVLTAANGDQLVATYSGLMSIQGTIATMTGGFQIIGGTGRFAQAVGAGLFQGSENISVFPATGQVELTGTISY
jgi:hypothetical protein